MIRVEKLCAGYGNREVLHDISLTIGQGEMVGLLGPNGGGKSTLLLSLSGVLPVRSGRIYLDNQDLSGLSPKAQARRLAAVPQRLDSAFDLPAFSVVLMGRYPYISFWGGYDRNDREIARQAMEETSTSRFKDRLTGELSGGEHRRVFIARALAQQTDLLLLDEAASGLDIARKVEIYDLLKKKHLAGTTILSAIHDLNLAALYCPRLVFLKNGCVALDGPTPEVFTEKKLAELYETEIRITPHPVTGQPQAHFVPADVGTVGHHPSLAGQVRSLRPG